MNRSKSLSLPSSSSPLPSSSSLPSSSKNEFSDFERLASSIGVMSGSEIINSMDISNKLYDVKREKNSPMINIPFSLFANTTSSIRCKL